MPDSIQSSGALRSSSPAWKLCALTCLTMVLLSLIPQIHLWFLRGKDWNGAYVNSQGDEPLYSAYVNALINGRARKNDPFGGRDDSPETPLPESFFSIQFVPAYAIALPARLFGLSTSTAFIVLIAVAALLASASVFGLLNYVTSDQRLAAAGTLFVLCLGRFIGRYGLFGTFLDIGFPALPFLRRYQPAVAFPLFFVFQLLVWRALTSQNKRSSQVSTLLAGLTLSALIFSYLYLWTTAVAWLACIGVLCLLFRPSERRKTLAVLTAIGVMAIAALMPYMHLLSQRAKVGDEDLILVLTHRPDLFRTHEILGAVILIALVIGVWRHKFERSEIRLIYAASLALLPIVVFNQQVLTGRTMQVFHFENFVVSYSTLVGLLFLIMLFWNPVPKRLLVWMAGLSFAWGIIAAGLPAQLLFLPGAVSNDRAIPVLRRLKELAKDDGTLTGLRAHGHAQTLVFSPNAALISQLPTWTSQGTLLDETGLYCAGLTREDEKKFLYMHLYYSGVNTEALREALSGAPTGSASELSNVRPVIFGHERLFPFLSSQPKPILEDEVESELQAYIRYASSFSREEVLKRPISYAIVPAKANFDFSNVDRWYERSAGESFGDYVLYRLKLRE